LLRVHGQLQPRAPPRLPSASSLCAIVLSELDELDELGGAAQKILQLYCGVGVYMHGEGTSFTPAQHGKPRCCVGEGDDETMSWEQRPAFAPSQRGLLNNDDRLTSVYH
jgi:hypothetical protein